ncbi:MAG: hypothetical protein IPO91_34555 [Chloroflexi bacterium]|nr:hypothetical protein [Chloroflexota bacterium]
MFSMYIVHLAVPYNFVETMPETLLDFVNAPTAHCGVYSLAQSQVYGGLGLTWRNIVIDGGWHGLIEVQIDGAWEVFDSIKCVGEHQRRQDARRGMTACTADSIRRYWIGRRARCTGHISE